MLTFATLAERQAEFKARLLAGEVKRARRTSSHSARCLVHGTLRTSIASEPNKRVCADCRRAAVRKHRQWVQIASDRRDAAVTRTAVVRIDQHESQRKVVEIRRTTVDTPQCPLKWAA